MKRSPWRLFLPVFLMVLLGGLGVSGAAALWSMQTDLTARVTTGTWDATSSPASTSAPALPSTPAREVTETTATNSHR